MSKLDARHIISMYTNDDTKLIEYMINTKEFDHS
uniref:Uncharacterized protein n=1 Tax=Tetranychus urticae TaxID=32264 RepID=T1KZM0_TETUR